MTNIEDRIQNTILKRGMAICHAEKQAAEKAKRIAEKFGEAVKTNDTPEKCTNITAVQLDYVTKVGKRGTGADTDEKTGTVAELLADLTDKTVKGGIDGRLVKMLKYLVAHGHGDLPAVKLWANLFGGEDIVVMQNLSQYLPKNLKN